jgi:hypothetical protein
VSRPTPRCRASWPPPNSKKKKKRSGTRSHWYHRCDQLGYILDWAIGRSTKPINRQCTRVSAYFPFGPTVRKILPSSQLMIILSFFFSRTVDQIEKQIKQDKKE